MEISVPSCVSSALAMYDDRVVSVSGGPDSMLLLEWCRGIAQESGVVLHVWTGHHGVRDDADDDIVLVCAWCQDRAIDCVVGYYDGDHSEASMRSWRRTTLLAIAHQYGACILTGHHLDDRIETTLHRLWKGSGFLGVGPLPAVDGIWIRPLVHCSKDAILSICRIHKVPYHLDNTNLTEQGGQRNWMRQVLIPLIKGRISLVDFYVMRSEWFVSLDTWRERLQGSYEIIDLPNSPFWSKGVMCQGVKLMQGAKRTPSLIGLVLMDLGVYRHQNSSGMDVLMRFFDGQEGGRLDYGDVILWYMGDGRIVVTWGGVFWECRMSQHHEGWRLMKVGDKMGSQSMKRYLQKQGVPLIWRWSALVREEDGVIVDWKLPEEYMDWKVFI